MIHFRRTQHWTYCGMKVRLAQEDPHRVLASTNSFVSAIVKRPDEVCRACREGWRNDPNRRW